MSEGRDHFLLIEEIGRGGMGEVFLALQLRDDGRNVPVIVKRILPELANDAQGVMMFRDEARIVAAIDHPNVVHLLEYGRTRHSWYMAMELVRGCSLAHLLEKSTTGQGTLLGPQLAAFVCAQVTAGLFHAHNLRDEEGNLLHIVHRDLAPLNILISLEGEVKLIDFGIARARGRLALTSPGTFRGRPGYLAPEQVRYGSADHRSDVFAVGVVLWELLVGRRLFRKDDLAEEIQAVLSGEVFPPSDYGDTPEELDAIVLKCLEKDPARRYQSARDVQTKLESWLAGQAPVGATDLAAYVRSTAPEQEALWRDRLARTLNPKAQGQTIRVHSHVYQSETPSLLDALGQRAARAGFKSILVSAVAVGLAACLLGFVWLRLRRVLPAKAPAVALTIPKLDNLPPSAPWVTNLPTPWIGQDVGNTAGGGSAEYRDGAFRVSAPPPTTAVPAGDTLAFVWRPLPETTELVAHLRKAVPGQRAGIIVRRDLGLLAAFVEVCVSAVGGTSVRVREDTGAAVATYRADGLTADFLKLTQSGQQVAAWVSSDGRRWLHVTTARLPLPVEAHGGLFLQSGGWGKMTVEFDGVEVRRDPVVIPPAPPSLPAMPTAPTGPLPRDWTKADFQVRPGQSEVLYSQGMFAIRSTQQDLWERADAGTFVYRTLTSDRAQIVARILSVTAVSHSSKGGIHIREDLDPGAANVSFVVSADGSPHGAHLEWRAKRGAETHVVAASVSRAPCWLKLVREGGDVTGFFSRDGKEWWEGGRAPFEAKGKTYAGLIGTGKDKDQRGLVIVDDVSLE